MFQRVSRFVWAVALTASLSVNGWAASAPRYKHTRVALSARDAVNTVTMTGREWGVPYRAGTTQSPGTEMGSTYWDAQHLGSVGRQVDEFGGKIQCTWMKSPGPSMSVRDARWNRVNVTGSPTNYVLDNAEVIKRLPLSTPLITGGQAFTGARPGYTNFRNRPSGRGLAIYHDVPEVASLPDQLWTQMDLSVANGIFAAVQIPEPADPRFSEDGIIWPKVAVAVVGADTVFHAVGGWLGGDEVWYFRGTQTGAGSCTWYPGVQLENDASSISPVVEANGSEVTVVYLKQFNTTNSDVVYRRSTDGGLTWGAVVNVTNYAPSDPHGANQDVNAAYDMSGNLHIIWPTQPASGDVTSCNLYQWSSATGTRLIASASWRNICGYGEIVLLDYNNGAGVGNLAIADPGLSVKPAGVYGPNEQLYAVWTQYGPTDFDCATIDEAGTLGGLVNAEIYISVSTNSGLTWDRPQNITGTETPNCLPGNCESETWATVASRADSGLYVSYVMDTHAGAVTWQEGRWSESPYMVLAVEARQPVLEPVIAVYPLNFYELNAKTYTSSTTYLTIANVGNANLNWQVQVASGLSNVLVNGGAMTAGTIVAGGAPQVVAIDYDGIGLPDPSEQNWRLEVMSNDSRNDDPGEEIDVNLEVFVADTWYTCTQDTISTSQHRLSVSSCLELFDQDNDGGGFFGYADSSEWGFSASPFITRLAGATKLAWRNVFFGPWDRRRELNQSFRAQSPNSVARTGTSDIATGTASNTDTTIGIDYEFTSYKGPDLRKGFVAKLTLQNLTGSPMTGVDWGALFDCDVTNDSTYMNENKGFGNLSKGYIGMQGVKGDTDGTVLGYYNMYAATFHVPLDGACTKNGARDAQILDNADYVYKSGFGFVNDSVYLLAQRFGATAGTWGTNTYNSTDDDTVSDLSVMLISGFDQTLLPSTPVTYAFGFAVSDISSSDLENTIQRIREEANPACGDPCNFWIAGDVNINGTVDSLDVVFLAAFLCDGGPWPPLPFLGNVNGDCIIDSADLRILTSYVQTGEPPLTCTCESPALGSCTTGSLVAHWALDEGSGGAAYDETANNNDGALMNGPTWVPGRSGTALEFDGTDDYVNVPDKAVLRPASLTVMAWLKPYRYPTLGTYGPIVKRTPWANDANWQMQVSGSGRVDLEYYNSGWHGSPLTSTVLELNKWSHVAVTFASRVVNVYVNGRKDASYPWTGPADLNTAFTSPVIIGKGNQDAFDGIIDDVKIYNRALSEGEVAEAACSGAALGDVDCSLTITAADIIYLVNYVFKGGPEPRPNAQQGNVNCQGEVTSADIIFLVNYVFKSGTEPNCG